LLLWNGEYIKYGVCLAAPRNPDSFFYPKIFIRRTDDKILAVYDEEKYVGLNSIHCLQPLGTTLSLKYILSILNSNLINWYFQVQNFHMVGKPLAEVKVVFVERLPIVIPSKQEDFIKNTDLMLALNKSLLETSQKFQRTIQRKFNVEDLPTKLQDWYLLTYSDFIKELAKKKIKLSLSDEAEWETYFIEESKKALEIKTKIETTDKEIDQMVYKLYDLTPEEIEIVEKS
jgi:hypothetical protein